MTLPAHRPERSETIADGRLVENIMFFGRVLRAAGLPIGPGQVIDAVRATATVGVTDREIFYWALHAVLVNRREQRVIFDQAFHIFWRNPRLLERMLLMVLPTFRTGGRAETETALVRRVQEALAPQDMTAETSGQPEAELQVDAVMTYSGSELLQSMDFEKMSVAEVEEARRTIARMRLPVREMVTRRFAASPRGRRIDPRRTMRASLRDGGDSIPLRFTEPRRRPPPIVALCDISGSMGRYSRMLLHFLHALTNDRMRVQTFLFGTRLTNVTRYLRQRDVDEALAKVGGAAADWSGGTRIGLCLRMFNRDWSRRVLGQGAVVLLISDGLDRDAGDGLAAEVDRLHRSCRRLIWLNPLLRFDGFAPKSRGIRAILPHVDEFRPVHSLNSLQDLADAFDGSNPPAGDLMARWRAMLDGPEPTQETVFEGMRP